MSRNFIKCSKGHFYDPEKYSSCPFCSSGPVDPMRQGDLTVTIDKTVATPSSAEPQFSQNAGSTPGKVETNYDAGDVTIGMAFWNEGSAGSGNTAGIPKIQPVVGWLVCVSGSDRGKSFTLKAGRNYIGRSPEKNDVVISGDNSISREQHGILIFDPKSGIFYAQPGISRELFYVNDEVVLQVREIADRDRITLGNTSLIFVGFCSKEVSWEDLK